MKQIVPAMAFYEKMNKEAVPDSGTEYRLSRFCVSVPCADGTLLYHTLSGELWLLSGQEAEAAGQSEELIRHRFLVPKDFQERAYTDQFYQLAGMLGKKKHGLTDFTIFTTMDCNARCFYCYEFGRPRPVMPEQTAHDVASFITDQSKGQKVKIRWFGGEPLYNLRVIDIITDDLRQNGVSFQGDMASNGYLFDPDVVRRAGENWNLTNVQITLDGTEEVYNKAKAFIYKEGSPYQRVMNSIGMLLDSGIQVNIRLNLDEKNAENLNALVDEIVGRFENREKLLAYLGMLTNFDGRNAVTFHDGTMDKYERLLGRLRRLGLYRDIPKRVVQINCCMADNDNAVTVLPDGRLGKCEHESENRLIGSIYSEERDQEMIAEWKKPVRVPECESCPHYPICGRLHLCDYNKGTCTELSRRKSMVFLKNQIMNLYEKAADEKGKS